MLFGLSLQGLCRSNAILCRSPGPKGALRLALPFSLQSLDLQKLVTKRLQISTFSRQSPLLCRVDLSK